MTELKRIRQMVGLNQESLALRLSISQSQYSRIENTPHNASVGDVVKILQHLKLMWDKQFATKLNIRQVIYRIAIKQFELD